MRFDPIPIGIERSEPVSNIRKSYTLLSNLGPLLQRRYSRLYLKTHGERCTLIYVEQAREKEERSWLVAHKAAAGGKLTEAAGSE